MMLQPLRSHPRNATEMRDVTKARLVTSTSAIQRAGLR
jgi:hypothetical protein